MYDGEMHIVKNVPLSPYEQVCMTAHTMSADELKTLIRTWLDADNPTHWGKFELDLNAVLETN